MDSATDYGSISSQAQRWYDLCATPCEFRAEAEVVELLFYGAGVTPAQQRIVLRPGSNVLQVDPGSSVAHSWFIAAEVLGICAMIAGGTMLALAIAFPEHEPDAETGELERDPMTAALWSWGGWLTGLGSIGFVGGLIGVSSTETEIEHHGEPSASHPPSKASPRLAASLGATF